MVAIDLMDIWGYRRNWHRGNLVVLLPGVEDGIIIGAFAYKYVNKNFTRNFLSIIAMLFALTYFTQKPAPAGGTKRVVF